MADKKISELPLLNSVSGSSLVIPIVHDGTTVKVNLSQLGHYASQWSAKTGSANTFTGTQSIIGNVNISGKLSVNSIEAVYETSSILYTSGSTQIGDQSTDVHTIFGTVNLNGLALGTNELMAQTASQAAVNLGISSTTGSINTTTASFDSVFLGISSVTGSINVQSSSQDLVNRGISSVTGAINTTTSSFNSEFDKIGSTTASLHFTTSSLNSFTGSIIGQNNTISTFTSSVNFATQSLNTQTGSQDLVNRGISSVTGSINTTTSSFDSVFLRISSTTGSINTTTSSFDSVFLRISSTTGSINTTTSSFDSVFLGISSVTGSLIGITNTLMAFTAALDNTYATDAQLYQLYQATASIHFTTQSLNTQTGSQDLVNRGISSVTGSINTTTSSFDLVFRGISSVTGAINLTTASLIGITNGLMAFTAALDNTYATDAQLYQLYQATASIHSATASLNTQTGSQDLVNRGISSVTGSINTTTSSFDSVFLGISSVTGAINLTTASLIGITNGLMAFTAALDSTYATDAQLYQLYQATASIHFATSSLNTQTGSQDLVNLGISTVTGSFRAEIGGIEAYTASLKAAAIVSSSTQIQNYFLFAQTSSANTFYGNQTITGRLGIEVSSIDTGAKIHIADTTNGFVGIRLSGSGDYTGTDWTLYASSEAAPSAIDFFGIYNKSTTDSATSEYKLKVYKGGDVNITNGNLVIGTSGKGIDFSATSNSSGTMENELFDDYEEGTWTPTYTGTNITINTYGATYGYYTKVGRLVTLTFCVMTESVTVIGSEYVNVGGLPFTAANLTEALNSINICDSSRWVSTPPVNGFIKPNTATIELNSNIGNTGAGQDPTRVLSSNMATGAGNRNMIRCTATYFTAT